jgi:hypothetical protein
MIKFLDVFDMDGCIVDSLHRYRSHNGKIDLQYWLDNEHKAMDDTLLPMADTYKKLLGDKTSYTMIATARVINAPDQKFIDEVLSAPQKLVSRRGRNDARKGADMKFAGIRPLLNLIPFKNVVVRMYEDNLDYLHGVCDRVEALGFQTERIFVPSQQGH